MVLVTIHGSRSDLQDVALIGQMAAHVTPLHSQSFSILVCDPACHRNDVTRVVFALVLPSLGIPIVI